MNCTESRQLLHAQADNELDVANSLELERHLQACAVCAAEREAVQSLKKALRESPLRCNAPESLRNELRRIVLGRADRPPRSLFQSLLLWKSLAFGAAAFALLATLTRSGISGRDQFLEEAISGHVRSLMAEHLTDVTSTDQHTVKPWFNGKLDFAPTVKDFAAQGFPLVGGRLDYLNGRAVAALVYRRNKHLINVFVWPAANNAISGVQHLRGYSVISREAEGLRYCLVSDLNQQELAELAGMLER
ncbi:MAG TPA: anti-sigma factor [Verrucomicrobiae bacterium]